MTAAQFRRWRERLGLTQVRAAESLGVKVRWVQRLEAGAYPVPVAIALACEALEARAKHAA